MIANWSVFVRIFFGQVDDTAFYESKVSIWRKKNVLTNLCLFHLSFAYLEQNNQGFFRKTIGSVVKMAFHVSNEIFCREFFFGKSSFSISALGIERTFSVISTEICRSSCQYCFLFVNQTRLLWKKFCQKFFFTSFLDIHPEIISLRPNFFSAKLTTLLSTSPKDQFEDITSFWQSFCLFFQWFLESERRNNAFLSSKNNRQVCHNCLPRVQEYFVKIFFEKKSFFHHWALSDFCMSFRRKFVGPLSVLLSVCQFSQFVAEKKFRQIYFPHYFRTSIANWSVFVRIFFRPSGRHCVLRVRRITLKTSICFENFLYVFSSFWSIERKINGFFCRKTNSSFVKTDYHLSRRSVEEIFFSKRFFFCSSLKLERISSWLSDKNFSAVSSKLLSVCALQQFVVKLFSVKNVFLSSFSDIQQKLVLFSKLFRSSWQNCIVPDHMINLRTYICFDKVFVCFFNVLWKLNREITVFFVEKQSEALSILLTTYPRGYFAENFFAKKFFFFIIGHWATFSCHFYGNLSVPFSVLFSACQMDQCVVKKLLSKIFFPSFLDIDRKIISLCSNFFRPSWRHCNLRVQGINLRT